MTDGGRSHPATIRWRAVMLVVAACLICPACGPATKTASTDDLPLLEPEGPDRADPQATDRYLRRIANRSPIEPLDWPRLFGPDRTAALPDLYVDVTWPDSGPELLWSVPCGTGYGSPVVASGRVIYMYREDDQEYVVCASADTGEGIWQISYPTTFQCDFEYSDGPVSTPVISGSEVFTLGGQGQCYCLSLEDGSVIWKRNFQDDFGIEDDLFALGTTPLVVDEKLIINIGAADRDAGVVALDLESGATIWQATDQRAGYCSPFAATIHEQPFLFVITAMGLVSLDPRDGRVDWTVEHRGRAPMSYNAVSPMVDGAYVLAMTGPGPGAVCVEVQPDRSQVEVWRDRRVLDSQYNTLMLADGLVYGFTAAGQGGAELRCIEMATGKLRWKYHSVLRRGQGILLGDAIVALGENGHLAAIDRSGDEPRVIAFTSEPLMKGPCYCTPATDGRRLYLKSEHRLACFELEAGG